MHTNTYEWYPWAYITFSPAGGVGLLRFWFGRDGHATENLIVEKVVQVCLTVKITFKLLSQHFFSSLDFHHVHKDQI